MRKCRHCKEPYEPKLPMQRACGIKCASALAKKAITKRERKETREAKARLKTKASIAREAQSEFNAWIRWRDRDLPCISCGRHHPGQYHAGHYRSVGAYPNLRFDPRNCHKQCAPCNNHKSGNIVEYRINLLNKIGAEAMEWLEGPHEPKRYTREDLIQIRDKYRKKLREEKKFELLSSNP